MSDNVFGIDFSRSADVSEEEYLLNMRDSIDKRLEDLKKNRETEKEDKQLSELSEGLSAIIYVDGSHNDKTDRFGYGVYMTIGDETSILYGSDDCREGGRNTEGEVAGAIAAMEAAKAAGVTDATVYYDYNGIEAWANKTWKRNKGFTKSYSAKVDELRESMNIKFSHTVAHTGVQGNEYVDRIAKLAAGRDLTKADIKMLEDISHLKGFPIELLASTKKKFGVNASGDKKSYLEKDAIKLKKDKQEDAEDFDVFRKRRGY